ncbi:MAG TPA: bifunctional 2-C-methyl-D-erythritol 4-phosphate cytidylyltransferase/2-C-methyl-D-erythritol 2,4-cyclodiphosphate synthase, partial [Clostridiales bacterium]|nr:bifunctional 2-C-methyl-D-erythritol 4-phosphate cytidylyltransferase/2-C-methyl-D-erythritol 2,4-cyclodiphosphate synthase [Clostridiales bacterium]
MRSCPYTTAVILAAGSGTRMGCPTAKQELCLLGESLPLHTLRAFETSSVDAIVVVVRTDEIPFAERECRAFSKVKRIVVGGADRRESAARGFAAIPEESELVAIHDAARPLITPRDIDRTVSLAAACGAAIPVTEVADTVKMVGDDGLVLSTLDRANLRLAATPQVLRTDLYAEALTAAEGKTVTDDAMMFEIA